MQYCVIDEDQSISTPLRAIQDKERHERPDKIRPSVRLSLPFCSFLSRSCHSLSLFPLLPLTHNLNECDKYRDKERERDTKGRNIQPKCSMLDQHALKGRRGRVTDALCGL